MSQHGTEKAKPVRENNLVFTWILFIIFMALFLGGIWVLSFGSLENVWPFGVGLGLFFLAFWIPQTLMGRSDTGKNAAINLDRRKPHEGREGL